MTQVRSDLQGHGEVEPISWARVQTVKDGVRLMLRVPRQVCVLGHVLA